MDFSYCETPVGQLLLAGDEGGLHLIRFLEGRGPCEPDAAWRERAETFDEAVEQLREYFAGRRRQFELSLAPRGTSFQQRVWQGLMEIPYGSTISYAELAARIGISPSALSDWKYGRGFPDPDDIRRLADEIGVPYERVLDAVVIDRGYRTKRPGAERGSA